MPTELLEPSVDNPNVSDFIDAAVAGNTLAENQEVTLDQIEAATRQFSPRTELDNQGLTRTIFEYNGTTFSFVGREETPMSPTIERSRPQYLGRESVDQTNPANQEKPTMSEDKKAVLKENHLTDEQIKAAEDERVHAWQAELDRFANFKKKLSNLNQENTEAPEHLLVEQSAYGLFSLLEHLQPNNAHWGQEREAVATNKYDEEALLLIDMATAIDTVGMVRNSSSSTEEQPPLGEAVVIAAVLGDKDAQNLAMSAVAQQEKEESEGQEQLKANGVDYLTKLEDVEAYKPEDLVVVHATHYAPDTDSRGFEVQTTHDAMGFPRPTIHVAINHKVESHMFGSWDDKEYVLVAGFDHMLEENGSPSSINGADTWWTRNPGEKLVFPDATLIAPGGEQAELFTRTDDGKVLYKTGNFTATDLETIDEKLGAGTKSHIDAALHDDSGKEIAVGSKTGQHIIANIIRDALVRQEITSVRGKELLTQSDDKFMSSDVQMRLEKMAGLAGLKLGAALHNGGSDEHYVESRVGVHRLRTHGMTFKDAKIRRTAYASGMMGGGGTARKNYLERRDWAL